MMKGIVSIAAVTALSGAAMADSIDVQNLVDFGAGWSGMSGGTAISQSFKPTVSNVSGLGIQLGTYWSADTITLSLYTSDPYYGGSPIASGSAYGTPGNWVDVFFSPVSVTPGATYYLNMQGTTGSAVMCYGSDSGYADGTMAYYGGNPGYDTGFRTWQIPAPGSLALLGLGGLAAARRRR